MTFRAVVQDGLIVVNTHGQVPDGTPVEIVLPKRGSRGKKAMRTRAKKVPLTRRNTPGFGMWADRTDLGTSETAVDALRKLTRRRRLG